MSTKPETPQESLDGPFYLEYVTIPEDSEDDYKYEEVPLDDDWSLAGGEEDLEAAAGSICDRTDDFESEAPRVFSDRQLVSQVPEVVDDFLRNFLLKMGMHKTLDCFQTEWYEMSQSRSLNSEQVGFVPDAYTHNQLLDNELKKVQRERDGYRKEALEAAETLVKLQKERDFHRMQHRRVVQEKNRLVEDIKRLKKHYSCYEPALQQLSDKYQATLKQKMLVGLERDRALGQARGVQLEPPAPRANTRASGLGQSLSRLSRGTEREAGVRAQGIDTTRNSIGKHPKDSEFPLHTHIRPHLSQTKALSAPTDKISGFHVSSSLKAHSLAISCLALHPRKLIVASAGDDQLWKMWGVPSGEVLMTGEGHSDWLSGCSFHPDGGSLATTGGDTTVKVWDFAQGHCVLTLQGHGRATWGCCFHSCGHFLASCSADGTAKVWDLHSQRCRRTLRGHGDSVNAVSFLPSSNALLTCSADKTLSLWDARTAHCAHTFYGHQHVCRHVAFNAPADTLASCDAGGVLKLWDMRKVATMATVDAGPHAANQVAFSPSGRVLAVASDDGSVKMLEVATSQVHSLAGHGDAVQSIIFDHRGEYLLSGGSDGTIKIWS